MHRAMGVAVRRAQPDDLPLVAEALAAAFHADPGWGHLLRDDGDRAERLIAFFRADLRHRSPGRAEIWMTADGSAAAVWAAPRHWAADPLTMMRTGPAMSRVFGRRLPLALRSLVGIERRHPRAPEHWYLHYLGVVPARQGGGLGSLLIAPFLERLDRDGLPAYLEASTERSAALYERHGFGRAGDFRMPAGGPRIRRMWREPRIGAAD